MKQISALTNQAVGSMRPASGQIARVSDDRPSDGEAFVNRLFRSLAACYPAWRQAMGDEQQARDVRYMWTKALTQAGVTQEDQIKRGVERARLDTNDFFPSPGKFISWCKPSPVELGMPTMPDAWREACDHCHSIFDHEWSHAGVYETGRRIGWFAIRNGSIERKAFEAEYQRVAEAVTDGQQFDIPKTDGTLLECHRNGDQVATESNKAKAADALAQMRDCLRM